MEPLLFLSPLFSSSQYWEIFLPGRGRDAICCVSTMHDQKSYEMNHRPPSSLITNGSHMQRQEHVPIILRALRASVRGKDAICCVSTVQDQESYEMNHRPPSSLITNGSHMQRQEHVPTILRALRVSVREKDAICCVSTVQ